MSETGQQKKFVLWVKADKPARHGDVLDIDTGVLRRDHVLVLRSPRAEITLGLGSVAGELLDFAHEDTTGDNALLDACDKADQAIARGDLAKSRALGIPDVITTIGNRALRRLALVECFLGKASPDDPDHPGWPAGSPGGVGGQFKPKDETPVAESAEHKLIRLKALREFRAAAQAALVLLRTAPLEEIPGIDIAASIKAAVDLAQIAIELGNDEKEIDQALVFIQKGPYTLDQLRVDQNDVSFSSFNAFKKIAPQEIWIERYGPAGDGVEYHHIVEQGGDNADNIPAGQLHSTSDIIPLPGPIHDLATAEYAKEYDTSGKTVREWLSGQSFEKQYEYGLQTLRNLGILK